MVTLAADYGIFNGDPPEKPVTWDDVVEFIVIIPISWLIRILADQ